MAVRKDIAEWVPIPHEPDEKMELRLLGFHKLDEARKVRQRESFENIKALGGDIYKAIAGIDSASSDATDPMNQYDRRTLLHAGIKGWTYVDADGHPIPVSPATIDELDEKTADWAARVIVGVYATGTERKNGSGVSTWPSMAEGQPPTSG